MIGLRLCALGWHRPSFGEDEVYCLRCGARRFREMTRQLKSWPARVRWVTIVDIVWDPPHAIPRAKTCRRARKRREF